MHLHTAQKFVQLESKREGISSKEELFERGALCGDGDLASARALRSWKVWVFIYPDLRRRARAHTRNTYSVITLPAPSSSSARSLAER